MNIADDLINFDTSFRYELGNKKKKNTFKSISYKSVTIEWEWVGMSKNAYKIAITFWYNLL